jgi:hypothetical protein
VCGEDWCCWGGVYTFNDCRLFDQTATLRWAMTLSALKPRTCRPSSDVARERATYAAG